LEGREFVDLEDFRRQLQTWLDDTVDHRRRHGTTALERFADEAPHLVPLPRHPYDTARVLYRVCSIDGFVDYGGNRYAVPYDHVTDILPLRITERELFVYAADFECVARHELVMAAALGDAIITGAILDRIVMNAIHLRIDGPSYRQQVAEDRAKERAERRRKARSNTPESGAKSKSTSHSRSKSNRRSSS
jgi:hypothetical protein